MQVLRLLSAFVIYNCLDQTKHHYFTVCSGNLFCLCLVQSVESKKEEFQKYLEKSGVVDALTKGTCSFSLLVVFEWVMLILLSSVLVCAWFCLSLLNTPCQLNSVGWIVRGP